MFKIIVAFSILLTIAGLIALQDLIPNGCWLQLGLFGLVCFCFGAMAVDEVYINRDSKVN